MDVCRNLTKFLERAAKFDSWGQRVEACDAYTRFCEECDHACTQGMDDDDRETLKEIANRSKQRADVLHQPAAIGALDDTSYCKRVEEDIETLREIAVKMKRKKSLRRRLSAAVLKELKEGGLLPPLRPKKPGCIYFSVKIDKIGLKDAMTHMEPFITISLKDAFGVDVTPAQNTPPAELYEEKHIIFNEDVHIQKPLEEIKENCAIIFEFKHFKPRKNKVSTKCFAFLEKDEIKPGPLALELYQKPVDYTRKKICLLTEKNLFLHLTVILHKSY